MITFANAKINLGLNIVEKRPDGYHNLETVFYPIPLRDAIEIEVKENRSSKIEFFQEGIQVDGMPENNLIVKAYNLLDLLYHLPPLNIYTIKKIPTGAGLGGGSADAAFMLKLLNEQFKLDLSVQKLEELAAQLGADCAFFIQNQPTYARGIGNIFSPVELSLKGYRMRLIKPDIFVSTKEAFARISPKKPEINIQEIVSQPVDKWRELLKNDFEESVFPQYPAIGNIKEELYRKGAIYAAMSGSGSSVFGIFEPNQEMDRTPIAENATEFFLTLE